MTVDGNGGGSLPTPLGLAIESTNSNEEDNAIYDEAENERTNCQLNFSLADIAFRLIIIFLFLLDVGSDAWTAYTHYRNGDVLWFRLTLTFLLVPGFITSIVSFKYYLFEPKKTSSDFKIFFKRWTIRGFFLITALSPLLRDVEGLIFGLKMRWAKSVREKQKYFEKMSFEDKDKCNLKLLLSFLEDGPQLILQFYIFVHPRPQSLHHTFHESRLLLTMISSLLGISLSLAFFHRTNRISLDKKWINIDLGVTFFIGLFTALILFARVLALGLLGFVCPLLLIAVIIQRYIVMTAWILNMKTTFCPKRYEEVLYDFLLGFVFIFIYVNPKNLKTRWRILFFYLYTFVENSLLIGLWFTKTDSNVYWYRQLALTLQITSYALGLILMGLYYGCLHPNAKFGLNIKTEENYSLAEKNVNDIAMTLS